MSTNPCIVAFMWCQLCLLTLNLYKFWNLASLICWTVLSLSGDEALRLVVLLVGAAKLFWSRLISALQQLYCCVRLKIRCPSCELQSSLCCIQQCIHAAAKPGLLQNSICIVQAGKQLDLPVLHTMMYSGISKGSKGICGVQVGKELDFPVLHTMM